MALILWGALGFLRRILANLEATSANVQFMHGFSGLGSVPRPPVGDHFILEDARRDFHGITFRDIPNWEVSPIHKTDHQTFLHHA